MTVWIIVATFRGEYDGIQILTPSEDLAQRKYRELVRESMEMPEEDWDYVSEAYERRLDDYRGSGSVQEVESFCLEEYVVPTPCPYCNGSMEFVHDLYDLMGYGTALFKCDSCGALQEIRNIPGAT